MLACNCLNILIEISENSTPNTLKLNMPAALSDAASFESVEFLKSVSFVCATEKMPFYYNKRKEKKSTSNKKKNF